MSAEDDKADYVISKLVNRSHIDWEPDYVFDGQLWMQVWGEGEGDEIMLVNANGERRTPNVTIADGLYMLECARQVEVNDTNVIDIAAGTVGTLGDKTPFGKWTVTFEDGAVLTLTPEELLANCTFYD